MREILFRGKQLDNGEWVYGSLLFDEEQNEAFIAEHFEDRAAYIRQVIPDTVGQYTGLTANGKKIFEGDYIFFSQAYEDNFIDRHIEAGYVEMKHGAFGLHRKQGWYRPFKAWPEDYEYEVIGNIHDNPELLKGGEQG